jgi:hypothetical protein
VVSFDCGVLVWLWYEGWGKWRREDGEDGDTIMCFVGLGEVEVVGGVVE